MEAIQIISQDLFDKVRSRFQNLEMGDKTGTVTMDPAEARFFDFDFVRENVNLGRVSISLNDLGSLKIFYSQGITEGQDDLAKKVWFRFLKEMRQFAMRRLLRFDTRDISKDNLDKNDFQYLASKQSSKEEEPMTTTMNESRWMLEKSSKKTSRAVKGRTQVIVRHSESMAERRLGERSNPKKIRAIYIENADGERFKYPFIHTAGAFAMAQHVDHGGIPHDPAGKAIIKMSEQIAQLQEFKRHIQRSTLNDDATGISERAVGRLNELKMRVEALGKRHHYESWIAEFNEQEHNDELLSELDPVTMEEYKSKFTQNSFNEELSKLFPLIHHIMQETNTIDLEEYTAEELKGNQKRLDVDNDGDIQGDDLADLRASKKEGFGEFEEWAESVEQGRLDLDAVNDKLGGMSLEEKLASISLGTDGVNAWSELSDLFDFDERDSDDEDLKQRLFDIAQDTENLDQTGLDSPAITVFKNWVEEKFPEWKQDLPELFSSEGAVTQPEPAPAQPAPAQAAPAPVAPAPEAPPAEQPIAEDKKGSMLEEIAKLINSRFNESNPTVGPFNGHEGILIDVEKTISEKFGEKAGQQARQIAEKYMQKLTMKWQQRHGDKLMGEKSNEISRLKELAGKLRAKVEGEEQPTAEELKGEIHPDADKVLKHINPEHHKTYTPYLKKGVYKGDYRDRADVLSAAEKAGHAKSEMESILKLAGLVK